MSLDRYESSVSNESLAAISNNFKCEICDHIFTTRYNLKRHNETFHDVERSDTDDASGTDVTDENISDVESSEEDEAMSEGENLSDDAVSSDEEDDRDSMSEGENSSNDAVSSDEEDGDSSDDVDSPNHVTNIFRNLLIDVYFENEDQLEPLIEKFLVKNMTKKEALIKAIFACDAAKKTLRRLFTKNILDIKEQLQHPLYKAINKKAREFVDDGLDEEEAISSAVSFRKHGIYNLINFI